MTDNQQPSFRVCKKCGLEKPLEQFAKVYSKKNRGKNYRQHTCQDCYKVEHAARQRKARKDNPEKYKAIQRKCHWKHRDRILAGRRKERFGIKLAALDYYGGRVCKCCGETELTMLTIDHIHENGAEHRRSIGWARNRSSGDFARWLRDNDYPEGYQVLCYNCNISKHRNNGVCAHKL